MDTAYYEELAGRLYGLLIGLDDRIGSEQAQLLHHFIEVGEYGLALEEIAGTLAQDAIAITGQERGDMLSPPRAVQYPSAAGSHHAQLTDVLHRQHADGRGWCSGAGNRSARLDLRLKTWAGHLRLGARRELAADLATWTRLLGFYSDEELKDAEPDTPRYGG